MRIIAEQAAFARAMGRIASVAPRRNTIPILSNVLIDAQTDAGNIWLHSTDLDMEIRERLEGQVEQPGQITVDAAHLSEIARNAPAGAEVAMTWGDKADPRALVQFGRSRYQLPVLPAGDFPIRSDLDGAAELVMPAADLAALLEHVHFAQSSEEVRYYLNGTYFHTLSDEGRPVFRVVATDGHRLAIDQRDIDGVVSFPGVIVPRTAVSEFRRLLAAAKGDVTLRVKPEGVALELADTRLVTKTVDGSYPDYHRAWPRSWDREILIDRAALHAAVKRVSLISAEKTRTVKMTIENEVLTLSVRNMEAGAAFEEIEVRGEGPLFETGFNAKYLLDYLEQTDADQMVFRVREGTDPARLDPQLNTKGAAGIVNVIMPVRV